MVEPWSRLGWGVVRLTNSNFNAVLSLLAIEMCLHQISLCLVRKAVVLLSQSDNHVTIMPSAKVVEIIWLIFIALGVQAVYSKNRNQFQA